MRSCHLDVDAVRSRGDHRAARGDGGACSRAAFAGRRGADVGADGRPPLRRPELGDRGRAAARAPSTGSCSRRCARASRTSTSCSTASAGQPGSPVQVRARAARGARARRRRRLSFDVADALVPDRHATRRMWLGGETVEVPVRARASIGAAPVEPGPLLVDEYDTTVVVPPGWSVAAPRGDRARSCSRGRLVSAPPHAPDPVTLQIVANALAVDRRRDGDDDHPHRALDGRARRDGLLGGALRRPRRDGRAGGQRPVPPRLDPDRDGDAARPLRRPRSGPATSS